MITLAFLKRMLLEMGKEIVQVSVGEADEFGYMLLRISRLSMVVWVIYPVESRARSNSSISFMVLVARRHRSMTQVGSHLAQSTFVRCIPQSYLHGKARCSFWKARRSSAIHSCWQFRVASEYPVPHTAQ